MAESIHYYFRIKGQTTDCTEPPPSSGKDLCEVSIYPQHNESDVFTLQRTGSVFQITGEDASRVKTNYPNFKIPTRQLKQFIELKKQFYQVFGDTESPSTLTQSIGVIQPDVILDILATLTNFVVNGDLTPKSASMKRMLEVSVGNFSATFVDETLGSQVRKVLKDFKNSKTVDLEAKRRVDWLLAIDETREKFWELMDPEFKRSRMLRESLSGSSRDIMVFLFSEHVLADKGFRTALFETDYGKKAPSIHQIVMSKEDPSYDASKNYYEYMAGILTKLKRKIKIPEYYREDFNRRLDFTIAEYKKQAVAETERLLPNESPVNAIRLSLKVKYNGEPKRREALDIILSRVKIQVKGGEPRFIIPMGGISMALQDWAQAQPTQRDKAKAAEAMGYLLKSLFEQNGKMEIYWKGKWKKVPNFYYSDSLPLVGTNKSYLEALIRWTRAFANDQGKELENRARPHVAIRKKTLIGEAAVAALGFGSMAIPLKDPKTKHLTKGIGLTVGCTGAGAATGNLLSYFTDTNKGAVWFDVVGGLVGGAACSSIYALTTSAPRSGAPMGPPIIEPPPPTEPGPGTRFPTDPYAN